MRLSRWHIIGLIVIVLAVAAFFYYKSSGSSGEAGGNIPYKEYVVTRGTFQTTVSASGVVQPIDRVEIKSKASGRIDELPIEQGDYVHKGDLIARLDPTDVQAEVDQAQADLDIAEAELKQAQNTWDRQQKLYDKGLISQEAMDQAELGLAQAKGRMVNAQTVLDQAKVRLSETVVTAPISGVILQKYVEAGQIIASGISNVSGGTPIADIADMSSVYVEAGVDEIDVGRVRIGQDAVVTADAFPRRRFHGQIIRIAPEAKVEQNVTLFDVVIEVANEQGLLKSGMNATVDITIERQDNVLLVPALALSLPATPSPSGEAPGGRRPQGGMQRPGAQGGAPSAGSPQSGPQGGIERTVLVKEGNSFVSRDIEIGSVNFDNAVVLSGLKEGDTLGVPMVSRLKAANEQLEERIRSSRSFGTSGSSSSSSNSGGRGGGGR
jgi:HlyD family secretion protein